MTHDTDTNGASDIMGYEIPVGPGADDTKPETNSCGIGVSVRKGRSSQKTKAISAEDIQLEILGVLTTRGARTIAELAKTLGMKPHVVRYQLDQLLEHRQIERAIMLNQRALGHHVFNVLFDLPRSLTTRTLAFLEKRPEVSWLAENMGHRRFEVTYFASDMIEGSKLVHSLVDHRHGAT